MAGHAVGRILAEAKGAALPVAKRLAVRAVAKVGSLGAAGQLGRPSAAALQLATASPARPWGVSWPGRADVRTCAVDTEAMGQAFVAWQHFSLAALIPATPRRPKAVEVPDSQLTPEGLLHRRVFAALGR